MTFKKLGMVLFLFGVLISLFSTVFDFIGGFTELRVPLLVMLGAIVGLINISDNERINFLISSAVFIVATGVIVDYSSSRILFLSGLFEILFNLAVFIGASAIVVSLRMVFEYLSEYAPNHNSDLPSPQERENVENVWDIIVFVAVALVIVILVLESFFDLRAYDNLIETLQITDYAIMLIFAVDLVVLYNRSRNIKTFFKTSWLDVIAVIPLGSAFRLTKLVRGTRIVRIFTRSHRAVTRANRSAKYFSEESGFNKLMNEKKAVPQNKSSKKKTSKSKKSTKTRGKK